MGIQYVAGDFLFPEIPFNVARMAVHEAAKLGVRPFCVTIDEKASDYLPYLFGSSSYMLVRNAGELPAKLPLLYARLTG